MNKTERRIAEAFLDILETKSYKDVTVKDIADKAGVNRNTFYYYFDNTTDLTGRIFQSDLNRIIRQNVSPQSLEECLTQYVKNVEARGQVIDHIYNSIDKDEFTQILIGFADDAVTLLVKRMETTGTENLNDDEKAALGRFMKSVIVGTMVIWFASGRSFDLVEDNRLLQNVLDFPGLTKETKE